MLSKSAPVVVLGLLIAGCSTASEAPVDVSSSAQTSSCTAEEQAARWSAMVEAPIVPDVSVAGVIVSGPVILDDVKRLLCQGTQLGNDGSGEVSHAWGENHEVVFVHAWPGVPWVHQVQLNEGYKGVLSFQSRPGSRFGDHTYLLRVGSPIQRDGVDFELTWNTPSVSNELATELNEALMYSFERYGSSSDVDCVASGECVFGESGFGNGHFTSYRLGITFGVHDIANAPSTVGYVHLRIIHP